MYDSDMVILRVISFLNFSPSITFNSPKVPQLTKTSWPPTPMPSKGLLHRILDFSLLNCAALEHRAAISCYLKVHFLCSFP